MTTERRLERDLPGILADLAVGPSPDYLDDVLRVSAQRRQRPGWTFPERWIPMTTLTRSAVFPRLPLRAFGIVLVLAALLGLVLALGVGRDRPLPAPFGPAANGKVLYVADGDVFLRDSLSAPARLIAGGSTPYLDAMFSPRGTKMLVLSEVGTSAQAFVAAADGSNLIKIGGSFTELTRALFSPDESTVAIAHTVAGVPRISLVKADGSGERLLDLGMAADSPAWRPPNGAQFSFRGNGDGAWGLFLASADGTGVVAMKIKRDFVEDPYEALEPAWSPSGDRIVFHRLVLTPGEGNGNGFKLDVADVDRAGVVANRQTLSLVAGSDDEHDARWTPQGDQLVFQRYDGSADSLWITSLASGAAARPLGAFAPGQFSDLGYSIAPDGRQIIAHRYSDGSNWLVDVAGAPTVRSDVASGAGIDFQRVAP